VQHPNAVAVLDFAVNPGGVAYLVMELLEGHSLDKELEERGPLRPERCGEIVVPVCRALAAAHAAGLIHRDIKPSNVFLHRASGAEVTKILDFGIAKLAAESAIGQSLTIDGSLLGTADTMAPERFRRGAYGPQVRHLQRRRHALQMLAGRLPFIEHGRPAGARRDAGRGGSTAAARRAAPTSPALEALVPRRQPDTRRAPDGRPARRAPRDRHHQAIHPYRLNDAVWGAARSPQAAGCGTARFTRAGTSRGVWGCGAAPRKRLRVRSEECRDLEAAGRERAPETPRSAFHPRLDAEREGRRPAPLADPASS
jgi:serine/threonine protein kinase